MSKFFQPESDDQARDFLFKHCMAPHLWIKKVSLDSQGRVDVVGDVQFNEPSQQGTITQQLPMRFGHIEGSFIARSLKLTSLEGSPHTVMQTFNVAANQLTDLSHGPRVVFSIYQASGNYLRSLVGFPDHVGHSFTCQWNPDLPVLQAVMVKDFELDSVPSSKKQLQEIIHKYQGQGKAQLLNFALELKKAGFAGNARW